MPRSGRKVVVSRRGCPHSIEFDSVPSASVALGVNHMTLYRRCEDGLPFPIDNGTVVRIRFSNRRTMRI